jgi:hypothetical protein
MKSFLSMGHSKVSSSLCGFNGGYARSKLPEVSLNRVVSNARSCPHKNPAQRRKCSLPRPGSAPRLRKHVAQSEHPLPMARWLETDEASPQTPSCPYHRATLSCHVVQHTLCKQWHEQTQFATSFVVVCLLTSKLHTVELQAINK